MTGTRSRVRLKLQFGDTTLGPGKITLLECVSSEGSISAAARRLGLTYRRAWHLLNTLQQALDEPLLVTEIGGKDKGGAKLTPLGETLIRLYREAEAKATENAVPLLDVLNQHRQQV